MAIETKTIAETRRKWSEVTPARQSEYQAATPAAAQKWESSTLAAAPNFGAAVRAANIEARQAAGVRRAGSAKFARKVRDVGAARFGPGVQAAAGDYESAFAPYLQAIQGIDLPGRRPRGDPGNYQRVNAVGNTLHQRRLAAASAGG